MSTNKDEDKKMMEKLCGKPLNEQEVFEARQDFLGAFGWLIEQDKKLNPHLYENN